MLTKEERLKYSGLFQQAFDKGKSLYSKHFRLTFTKTRDSHKGKLPFVGFTISKNYSKSAVKRNRLKRQLCEIYRLYRQDETHVSKLQEIGLLVFSLKKSTTEAIKFNYQDLKKELESLLKTCSNEIFQTRAKQPDA